MSYLSLPRLAFSGKFQADVSTVNNDVRHYDNAAFEPRFQDPAKQLPDGTTEMNGWWNPRGTGAFRLVDVQVRRAMAAAGDSGTDDPAAGLFLNAQVQRTAAKMVDLDPQFQMGSALWGLNVALTDGKTEFMRGSYLAAPFRDLYFGRAPAPGSGGASAKYTSVLTDVRFADAAGASPVLARLRELAEANDNCLSCNFMTFGYVTNSGADDFTYGNITGSIGGWTRGSPRKFVLGRRFAPIPTVSTPFANGAGIGFFDGAVAGDTVSLDLSNALPLAATDGTCKDIGALHLAMLTTPDRIAQGQIAPAAEQDATLSSDDLVDLGEIPYRDKRWLMDTAGLVDLPVPKSAGKDIGARALALVTPTATPGEWILRIRETNLGLFLRADTMELRVDTKAGKQVTEQVTLYGARYGAPAKGIQVSFTLNPAEQNQGGSGQTKPPAPQAPIPAIGVPAEAVHFTASGTTGTDGSLTIAIGFDDPKNPRKYIDGQIYKINYTLPLGGTSALPVNEQIIAHVRDAYTVPEKPTWDDDIKPILVQYGNLYPIMSQGLFSFSDEEVVRHHARILAFAFTRPLADPNHMPVTRDLSADKRAAILKWLGTHLPQDEAGKLMAAATSAAAAATMTAPGDPVPVGTAGFAGIVAPSIAEGSDGKTQAMRDILTARRDA